ncbi:uncharacterized protein METZ01_LOCUS75656 [marine metagenome]|uniref:Glycosyl hydrolase-like 10 domain-containing protein n=1 Tax=marine metagenome TaxID=408172 RepID=A0A381U3I0_9ZZZZ
MSLLLYNRSLFPKLILLLFSLIGYLQANPENEEFRATWVITWDHIDRNKNTAQNISHLQQIINDHKTANMNAILFQVRQSGTAYYSSAYEPWGYYAGYQDPGYDPLTKAIELAHEKGMEVHAWFNVFQTSSTRPGSPAYEHPEWICRDQNGTAMSSYRSLSPGLPAVREYTVKIAMEIVNNYDIDGLHLDYVRWNEHTNSIRQSLDTESEIAGLDGMISEEILSQLTQNRSGRYLYDYLHPYSGGIPSGYSSWEDWWRWSVTEFVSSLHDSIQRVKPHVRLSAAVLGKYNWSGWQGYGTVFQDGALWFNEGYLDHLMPMHYHWTTASGFTGMLSGDCPECWVSFIQDGIESGRSFTVGPGSYILADNNLWNNHSSIIGGCRSLDWVDGFQFFSYATWDDNNYFVPAGETFFRNLSKIKLNPITTYPPPSSPTLVLSELNNDQFQLISYPGEINEPVWLITYRSLDPNAGPDNANIIDIQFTQNPISIIDQQGINDTANTYLYFSTVADRYWNESTISNTVFSTSSPMPNSYTLNQNYPNPFNSQTEIVFSIPKLKNIKIEIWSLDGRLIKTLLDSRLIPGQYGIKWFGKNNSGKIQSTGIYFSTLSVDQKIIKTRKLIYVK